MAQVVKCQSLTGGLGSIEGQSVRFVGDQVLALGYAFTASASVVHSYHRSTNALQTLMKYFTSAVRS